MFTSMEITDLYKLFSLNNTICTDTRKITAECIFFALKGDNFNGNQFALEAIKKGAAYAIIDEQEYNTSEKTILVENVLKTLQELANFHRKQFSVPFIGITGTNGKTTSKELINSVLSQHYKTYFTEGNLNNHIGVPLTLLSIKKDCEIAIIEMGANHLGEIAELCAIAEPDFGIITNIGTAHIEGFGSKEGVIKTKNEMYNHISGKGQLVFTNNDDELLKQLSNNIKKYTYSKNNGDVIAQLISETPNVILNWKNQQIVSNLYGKYNFYNILLAICVGDYFEVSDDKIKLGIESYVSSNNRSQLIKTEKYNIYLDAYNANPSSMNVAINSFASNPSNKKLMILGDMLELGDVSNEEHQSIADKANLLNINTLFVGQEFNNIKNKYEFNYFPNTEELINWIDINNIKADSILIKGSRGIRLEAAAEYIQKKEQ